MEATEREKVRAEREAAFAAKQIVMVAEMNLQFVKAGLSTEDYKGEVNWTVNVLRNAKADVVRVARNDETIEFVTPGASLRFNHKYDGRWRPLPTGEATIKVSPDSSMCRSYHGGHRSRTFKDATKAVAYFLFLRTTRFQRVEEEAAATARQLDAETRSTNGMLEELGINRIDANSFKLQRHPDRPEYSSEVVIRFHNKGIEETKAILALITELRKRTEAQ
jgi:hypothetical protein